MTPAPATVGPYRIVAPLGRGGMGVVYEAEHLVTAERVALKTLTAPKADLAGSIRREIHALSRVHHPGIVRIVEHGLHEGAPWYAMELLRAPTLERSLRGAGVPTTMLWTRRLVEEIGGATQAEPGPASTAQVPRILTLVRRLCDPLAYLHGEGIVHRDLKPANVLVREGDLPVIVDFGLATAFAARTSREEVGADAEPVGTVAYLAPEQGRGDLVDARADLYSLGCILFELLTGRAPFTGTTLLEVLQKRYVADPPSPSSLVGAELPPGLDALILRLLARDPRDRFGHASDVARALGQLGAGDAPSAVAPRPYLYRPGLAGRQESMASLEEHVAHLREGSGGVVLIGGESGVGKTRLAMAVVSTAREHGVRCLSGECTTERLPLGPLLGPLREIADWCLEKGSAAREQVVGARAAILAQHEPAFAALQEPGGVVPELPPPAARRRLLGAILDTLLGMAQAAPLLLVLDDLHWADELTLALLELAARSRRLGGNALLLLGTHRSEETTLPTLGASVARLELRALDAGSVGAIVGDMLALRDPPPGFVDLLARQCEGNPFFVAEYLRAAVEAGLLTREKGRWRLPGDAELPALPVPGSILELVGRRLEGIEEPALSLLGMAAVLGRRLDPDVLDRAGGLSPESSLDAVESLVRRHVLESDGPGLRFTHDKIREAAYGRIPGPELPALHRSAAAALAAAPGAAAHEAEIAHHHELGGQIEEARRRYLAAGRAASRRSALAEAERCLRAGIRLGQPGTAEAAAARIDLATKVLAPRGQLAASERELRLALDEASPIDPRTEALAIQGLGIACKDQGRIDEGRELLRRALARHEEAGDIGNQAVAHDELGVAAMERHELGAARQHLERALALSRQAGDRWNEGGASGHLGILAYMEGALDEARRHYDTALTIAREVGDRQGEGIKLCNVAILDSLESRWEAAELDYRRALAIARDIGDRRLESIVLGNLASVHLEQGRRDEGEADCAEAVAIARETGDRRTESVWLHKLGDLRLVRGLVDEAREMQTRAAEQLLALGDRSFGVRAVLALAAIARVARDGRESRRQAERAARALEGASLPALEVALLCERGFQEAAAGRDPSAHLERARAVDCGGDAETVREAAAALARLGRARDVLRTGGALVAGEAAEDVPEPVADWTRSRPRKRSRRKRA